MSKESRFVGYLVLGFGVLAVLTVLILAFSGGDDPSDKQTKEQKAQSNPKAMLADIQQTPAPKKSQPKKEHYFKRNKNLDVADMQGDWQGTIGRYTAVLQIRKNVYQIILAIPGTTIPRKYSSGTFKAIEDLLVFTPRMDWPVPASASGAKASYGKLTRSAFPMIAVFEGGKMLWQNPPPSEKRVVSPYISPLFLSENVYVVTWKKL